MHDNLTASELKQARRQRTIARKRRDTTFEKSRQRAKDEQLKAARLAVTKEIESIKLAESLGDTISAEQISKLLPELRPRDKVLSDNAPLMVNEITEMGYLVAQEKRMLLPHKDDGKRKQPPFVESRTSGIIKDYKPDGMPHAIGHVSNFERLNSLKWSPIGTYEYTTETRARYLEDDTSIDKLHAKFGSELISVRLIKAHWYYHVETGQILTAEKYLSRNEGLRDSSTNNRTCNQHPHSKIVPDRKAINSLFCIVGKHRIRFSNSHRSYDQKFSTSRGWHRPILD